MDTQVVATDSAAAVVDSVKVEIKNEDDDLQEKMPVKVDSDIKVEDEKEDTLLGENTTSKSSSDPLFHYLERGYTSENFKVELRNLPKFVDHGQFHTFLRKQGIKFSKAKVIPPKAFKGEKNSHAYLSLRSAEAKAEAMLKLSGLRFRGLEMCVNDAVALPDPLMLKRKETEQQNNSHNNNGSSAEEGSNKGNKRSKKQKEDTSRPVLDDNFDDLPAERRDEIILSQVASLWNTSYPEQLQTKAAILERLLRKDVFYELLKTVKALPGDAVEQRAPTERAMTFFKGVHLTSEGAVVPSPVLHGYRNKCEFNIDAGLNIGFRLGQYKQGSLRVVRPPANCPIVSEKMQAVIASFGDFMATKSRLAGFSPLTHEGHWRQILVRTTRAGECLLSVALHRQALTEEQLQTEVVQPLKRHFFPEDTKEENPSSSQLVTSLYLQVIPDTSSQLAAIPLQLLGGSTHVYETLLNGSLRFRISPLSFFQVNTEAAELLYGKIAQLAAVNRKTIVLDVCCGTGTIGLTLARSAKAVIGLELNEQAIEDAKYNAELNGIGNVTYRAGRAEALIGEVLEGLAKKKKKKGEEEVKEEKADEGEEAEEVVAVLDPPRNGLASSLIKALRNNERISRIVYVACEAKASKQNFIDLCRPKSKAYFGVPFVPVSVTPVDMFPHTDRCELILLFERFRGDKEVVSPSAEV